MAAVFALADRVSVLVYGRVIATGTPEAVRRDPAVSRSLSRRRGRLMLRVEGLECAYGRSRVLFGIDLTVAAGEVVTLLGRNGMGKTTTVNSIFGLLTPLAGRVMVDGVDVTGRPPHVIARHGLGLVPEGRQIFPTLTVEENLVATQRGADWTLTKIYTLFPRLQERRRNMGNQLSGGEQQMLAIGARC